MLSDFGVRLDVIENWRIMRSVFAEKLGEQFGTNVLVKRKFSISCKQILLENCCERVVYSFCSFREFNLKN